MTVIDLTHQIPVFDVRAGSHTLVRSVPHLGPGVVLAVVDPGVGSARRGVCLQAGSSGSVSDGSDGPRGPRFFVGPDNGLLVAAAELAGGGSIARGVELEGDAEAGGGVPSMGGISSAPAAAALCRGVPLEELGPRSISPRWYAFGRRRSSTAGWPTGRRTLRVEITWVDHFGNLQLAETSGEDAVGETGGDTGRPLAKPGRGLVELSIAGEITAGRSAASRPSPIWRRPSSVSSAMPTGTWPSSAGQASAAGARRLAAGDEVVVTW